MSRIACSTCSFGTLLRSTRICCVRKHGIHLASFHVENVPQAHALSRSFSMRCLFPPSPLRNLVPRSTPGTSPLDLLTINQSNRSSCIRRIPARIEALGLHHFIHPELSTDLARELQHLLLRCLERDRP